MPDPDAVQSSPELAWLGSGYGFHDAGFVGWWLRSLYMLPPDLQLEAAQALRTCVHLPAVHAIIDDFCLELLQQLEGQPAAATAIARPAASSDEEATSPHWQLQTDTTFGALQRLWRKSPVLTALGLCGLAVMVLRGVQVLARWIA